MDWMDLPFFHFKKTGVSRWSCLPVGGMFPIMGITRIKYNRANKAADNL